MGTREQPPPDRAVLAVVALESEPLVPAPVLELASALLEPLPPLLLAPATTGALGSRSVGSRSAPAMTPAASTAPPASTPPGTTAPPPPTPGSIPPPPLSGLG